MKLTYQVLIELNGQNQPIKLFCPDLALKVMFDDPYWQANSHTLVAALPLVTQHITEYLQACIDHSLAFNFPSDNDYNDIVVNNCFWSAIIVNVSPKPSWLSRTFAFTGASSAILSSFASGFTSLLALSTTQDTEEGSKTLGLSGAFFTIAMGLTVFFYSKSIAHAKLLAEQMNNRLKNCTERVPPVTSDQHHLNQLANAELDQLFPTIANKKSVPLIANVVAQLFYQGLAFGDVLTSTILTYQVSIALFAVAQDQNENFLHAISDDGVYVVSFILAILNFLRNAYFEMSFSYTAAISLAEKLTDKLRCCSSPTEQAQLSDEDESAALIASNGYAAGT